MKKLLLAFLIALGLALPMAPRAEALPPGAYLSSSYTSCSAQGLINAYGYNYICIDISESTMEILDDSSNTYYVWFDVVPISSSAGAFPTRGWVTWDANCNSVQTQYGWSLSWQVGSSYGLNSKTVRIQELYFGAPNPSPWWVTLVPKSATEYAAWFANSNSGYECIIVP